MCKINVWLDFSNKQSLLLVLRMLLMKKEISNLAVLTVYVPPTHGNDIICTPCIPHAEAIQSVIHPTQWQSLWKCWICFPPRRPLDFCVLVETKAFQVNMWGNHLLIIQAFEQKQPDAQS